MQIVNATPGDLGSIQALLAECNLPDQDLTSTNLGAFLLLRQGEDLVGSVGLEIYSPNALLRSLAIRQAQRGQGLGKELLSACESEATMRGVRTLYLLTNTAEKFFATHGYQRIERSAAPETLQHASEFRSLCPSSAVCMRKRLT